MSTTYVTKEPMSLTEFRTRCAEIGGRPKRGDGGRGPWGVMFPTFFAYGTEEAEGLDGKPYVVFTRFGLNDATPLLDHIDCIDEYDETGEFARRVDLEEGQV